MPRNKEGDCLAACGGVCRNEPACTLKLNLREFNDSSGDSARVSPPPTVAVEDVVVKSGMALVVWR